MILPLYITSFFVASSIFRGNFKAKSPKKANDLASSSPTYAEVVEPGLIIIRNYFTESEQKRIAEGTLRWDPNNRKDLNIEDVLSSDEGLQNTRKSFPKWATSQACAACSIARKIDPSIPQMNSKNMLLNMITSSEGYVCHRNLCQVDDEENYSIANVCVGASCRFRVKELDNESRDRNPVKEITLRSGDIVLSSGNKKYSLLEVLSEDFPQWLGMSNRLAFTSKSSNEDLEALKKEYLLFKLGQEHLSKQKRTMKKLSSKRNKERQSILV